MNEGLQSVNVLDLLFIHGRSQPLLNRSTPALMLVHYNSCREFQQRLTHRLIAVEVERRSTAAVAISVAPSVRSEDGVLVVVL